ncbi:hypothetical protein [Pseudomonas chlororaphis]|uniref:hypothetical protein n=1 Tax=Pseudomonas chlororaphis TaxID=587753 RepID=UPI0012DAA21E|nr:hypothetical protein [Pseudomonas chlororaphis]
MADGLIQRCQEFELLISGSIFSATLKSMGGFPVWGTADTALHHECFNLISLFIGEGLFEKIKIFPFRTRCIFGGASRHAGSAE